MSAFMSAILFFTFTDESAMLFLHSITMAANVGTIISTTRASFHSMQNITISAPTIVTMEISMSSGPWCASSVISNKSPVRRFISLPVLFLS